MSKFGKTDEKEFLLGYLKFTCEIRIKALKALSAKFDKATSESEKLSYYVLGLEQLFLLFESLQGFYVAFRDRKRRSFIDSLDKNTGIQALYDFVKDKTKAQILKDLNYFSQNSSLDQNKVEERLSNVANMWGNKKFKDVMKIIMDPMFNAIKHKLMLYEKDGKIMFVLGDKKEEEASKLFKDLNLRGLNTSSFNDLLEITLRWVSIIKDIIILRLLELGIHSFQILKAA